MRTHAKFIARAGLIAALYAALTLLLAPVSYGIVQLRAAEALTVLPMLTPAAVPGLAAGCLIANLLGPGASAPDLVFGTLSTLLAALCTRRLRRTPLPAALCPVVVNGVIVGAVLALAYGYPLPLAMASVAAGELIACCALGLPLYRLLRRLNLFS